jgi:PAS domain S-box-containing protein
VTRRAMAEAMAHRLELSSDPLERVSALVGGAVFVLDADGRIRRWLIRAARMTGFSRKEAVGRHCRLLYTPEDVAAGKPDRDLALAAYRGRHWSQGSRLRRGGSRYRAWTLITPLVDGMDHLAGFCCVLRYHSGVACAAVSQDGAHTPSPDTLDAIATALGYAALLDTQPDPELIRVARHALLPLLRDGTIVRLPGPRGERRRCLN